MANSSASIQSIAHRTSDAAIPEGVSAVRNGPVTTIHLNRPRVRNCVDGPTARALYDAFLTAESDPNTSAIVLYGCHGTFCAGADLSAVSQMAPDGTGRAANPVQPVLPLSPADPDPHSIEVKAHTSDLGPMGPTRLELTKPTIAAIAGHAVAGGLELACWCDMRVGEEDSEYGVFCRRFGVPLIDGGTVRLPRLIGQSRAMDMILTGRTVKADEALSFGLLNRIVPSGQARQAAEELARSLCSFPQKCLRVDRWSAIHQHSKSLRLALEHEGVHAQQIVKEESIEGAKKFVQGQGRHGKFDGTPGKAVPGTSMASNTESLTPNVLSASSPKARPRLIVVDRPEKSQFEIQLAGAGGKDLAYLQYTYITPHEGDDAILDLQHTIVPSTYSGQGIAAVLVQHAFELAKEKDIRIRPTCTYIHDFVKKRPEWKTYLEGYKESVSKPVPPPVPSHLFTTVLFDLGGVVVDSPVHAIQSYEKTLGLPENTINILLGRSKHFHELERGEIDLDEFCVGFDAEAKLHGIAGLSGKVLFGLMGAVQPRPAMLELISLLRSSGYLVGVVSNNWKDHRSDVRGSFMHLFDQQFDFIVESCVVGARKPETKIWNITMNAVEQARRKNSYTRLLGVTSSVEPAHCIFLDDLGVNLKSAQQFGMSTIKVERDFHKAITRLKETLGLQLPTTATSGPADIVSKL